MRCYKVMKQKEEAMALLLAFEKKNPWLTRNMINYFKKKNVIPEVVDVPSQRSHVPPTSDLTPDIINDTDVAALALLNIGSNELVRESSLEGENHEEVVADDPPAKNKGGRLKGSTNEAKSDALKQKKLAMNDAALKMKKLKEEAASVGKRLPRNAFTKILSDTSE
jgi:hypothetical protein